MTSAALVVIPVYRAVMTDLERFSLDRCTSILARHPAVFVGPQSLDFSAHVSRWPAAEIVRFPDRFFSSRESYSELLLQDQFYGAFSTFDHILIHQLDAYVLEDQLDEWCLQGWDYVGAPFVNDDGSWRGVGNGGFSLRRVDAHRKVLSSRRRIRGSDYWEHVVATRTRKLDCLAYLPRRLMYEANVKNDFPSVLRHYIHGGYPEDVFWGILARHAHPGFRVAPPEQAFSFAVECGIQQARDRLSRTPFGLHQGWIVEMVRRLVSGQREPIDSCERMVWDIACLAGLAHREELGPPLHPGPCRGLCGNKWPAALQSSHN